MYEDEALEFIRSAYFLMTAYEDSKRYDNKDRIVELKYPYFLKINTKGQLSLLLGEEYDDGMHYKTYAHSYNGRYSQTTYIGKLLASYLEFLQIDDGIF